MTYTIGLDLGTTSAKAVAFDGEGRVLARSSRPMHTVSDGKGRQEQRCRDIVDAVDGLLAALIRELGNPPEAIALSTHMHSLILVGEGDELLSDCILWSDLRAAGIAEQLRSEGKAMDFYRRSGTPVHAMSPLCKIAWFRKAQPELFGRVRCFADVKALLMHHFTGRWCTDHSTASASGLFDAEALDWYGPALGFCGIGRSRLPELCSPLELFSARAVGPLPEATKIVIGASDGCLANLGAGVLDGQTGVLTIGTSAAYRITGQQKISSGQGGIFSYLLSDGLPAGFPSEKLYVSGGASNNGAVAYQWFCEQWLGGIPDAAGQQALLSAAPPEPDGPLFLPHLYGERAPLWESSATGTFAGIRPQHGKAHFHRAVMEGILLNIALVAEELEQLSGPVNEIRAGGGFARSGAWLQMAADVFGRPLRSDDGSDDSARGAAMLANAAIEGSYPAHFVPAASKAYQPRPELHEIYRQKLVRFRRLCEKLYPSH
ncbi:MAG: gluconokinase [Saprospiraceae bacterium]